MSATTHRTPGETFAGYTELTVMTCGTCGIMFAMPTALYDEALADHDQWWHCPNGHRRHFIGKTAEQKATERANREAERAARERANREQAEAHARAQRAAATRARNERNRARKRSADGVCPCCGRSFKQIKRHMAAKHPDYDPAAA